MSVQFDAVGGGVNSATTPLTWTHTCGAGASGLLIGITTGSGGTNTVTGVTYNGVTCTFLGFIPSGGSGKTGGGVALYYLANPPSGANTVSVAFTGAHDTIGGSVSVTGSGGIGTVFTGSALNKNNVTLSLTSTTTGGLVVSAACYGGGSGAGTFSGTNSVTVQWQKTVGTSSASDNGASGTVASTGGGSAQTVGYSDSAGNDNWGLVAVELLPAASALVTPPPAPRRRRPAARPQVITGQVTASTPVSSADSGHGAGAVTRLAVEGADSAAGASGVPVIRPQGAGAADSGHGSAQGVIHVSASATGHGAGAAGAIGQRLTSADTGHGAGAVTQVKVEAAAAGHGTGAGSVHAALSSADTGHGTGGAPPKIGVSAADTGHGAFTAAIGFTVVSADTGRGIGSGFFAKSGAVTGTGTAATGPVHLSAAAAATGTGFAKNAWPSSADAGTGAAAALTAWPSSADAVHGAAAVAAVALSSADAGHGTGAYGDLGIWTYLPPSWSQRRGLVWITARLEDGELLELAAGLPPTRELLELARTVSSGPVRHIRAADSGRASAAAAEPAAVTVWTAEAALVAVWVEAV